MSLLAHEAVILTNYPLSDGDVSEINALVAERLNRRERYDDRRLNAPLEAGPVISGVFVTERTFELDFRPDTLHARYPKGAAQ